jgi:transcriptional regulator with GAF, ATPase, and Fis domain
MTAQIPSLDESQKQQIREALARTDGGIDGPNGAARLRGVHANTLRRRMKKLGITT